MSNQSKIDELEGRVAALETMLLGKHPMDIKPLIPVVLYFKTDEDKEEFILLAKGSNPNLREKKLRS